MTSDPPTKLSVRFEEFARYWLRLRGAHPLPAFADFDPVEVPWALARILVVEKRGEGLVYRIAGTEIESRYGVSLKGKSIYDIMTQSSAALIEARWRRVLTGPEICVAETTHLSSTGTPISSWRLILPFASDHARADRLMSYVEYFSHRTFDEKTVVSTETKHETWIPVAGIVGDDTSWLPKR